MAAKKITLKIARKKPGTVSRARVRSVVAAVYQDAAHAAGAAPSPVHVIVTHPGKKTRQAK